MNLLRTANDRSRSASLWADRMITPASVLPGHGTGHAVDGEAANVAEVLVARLASRTRVLRREQDARLLRVARHRATMTSS